MLKRLNVLTALAALLFCATAANAQWYAKGEFNGWDTSAPMADLGSGHHSVTIAAPAANTRYEFKIATADWSVSYPGGNSRVYSDAAGNITFHYYAGAQGDGWNPTSDRVGYNDPGIAWEVMGNWNGFSTPSSMTSLGSGVFQADIALAAGNAEFKFRKAGDWDHNIGATFTFNDANASYNAASADTYRFTLDLPNGRWQVTAVPEPASLGLAGLAVLGLASRRRRA